MNDWFLLSEKEWVFKGPEGLLNCLRRQNQCFS